MSPANRDARSRSAHEQLRRPLHAHGRRPRVRDLPARRAAGEVRRRAAAVRAQGPAREPAAQRGRADGRDARRHRGARAAGSPTDEPSREIAYTPARVLLQDFTGVPAVVDLAAMRDAMRDLGGDPARINPLQPAELVIDHSVQVDEFGTRERVPVQRRARVRAQQGALRVPALGPAGVRQLRRRAARHRHRAPGQPRVPRARGVRARARRDGAGLPRHAGRHRLAHHDGQRPRRARLGRGRDRGRGRDAGPAGLDADPAGDRLQARRRAAGGRDRHRPGPDRHADAARARAWWASSSSSSATGSRGCRSPTAPRSPTWRPSRAPPA